MSFTPHIAINNQHLYSIHTNASVAVPFIRCAFSNYVKLTSLYYQIFNHNFKHELLLAQFIIFFVIFPDE